MCLWFHTVGSPLVMKAVVFDLGRVLVHWAPDVVLSAVSEVSQATPAKLKALVHAVDRDFGTGRLGAHAFHDYLVAQAGTTADWEAFYAAFCQGLCRNEELISFAAELQKRPSVKVGIISNTNPIHTLWLKQHVPELASFDEMILSSEVGLLKPDPAIYHLALQRLGVASPRAHFIDDLAENVAAARALGIAGTVHKDEQTTIQAVTAWVAAH